MRLLLPNASDIEIKEEQVDDFEDNIRMLKEDGDFSDQCPFNQQMKPKVFKLLYVIKPLSHQ